MSKKNKNTKIKDISNGNLWYKDAVIYELHTRTFYDSSGDGIGDLRGLIQKPRILETNATPRVF